MTKQDEIYIEFLNIMDIESLKDCFSSAKDDHFYFQYLNNQSEDLKNHLFSISPFSIVYFHNQTDEEKLKAIESHPRTIFSITNPTQDLQIKAVKSKDYQEYKDLYIDFFLKSSWTCSLVLNEILNDASSFYVKNQIKAHPNYQSLAHTLHDIILSNNM